MENVGHVIGLIISIILIAIGWKILNKKDRGWGYYVLLIMFPLIGLIVAECLSDLSDSDDEPSNNITDYMNDDITNSDKQE